MKKISILAISAITVGSLAITSCQSEASSAEIEGKVSELYQAKKLELENQLAAECDSIANYTIDSITTKMAAMDAAHQKALLEKTQRELAAAKKKAAAKAKTIKQTVTTKTTTPVVSEDDRIKNAQQELLKNKGQQNVQKTDEEVIKAQQELLKNKGQQNVEKTDEEIKKAQQDLLNKFKTGQ